MMTIKKMTAVFAACIMTAALFAGCGGKEDNNGANATEVEIDPAYAADQIVAAVDFVHTETLLPAEGDVAENYYPGIGELEYAVRISAFGATAEEVSIFKGDTDKANELIQTRLAYQKASFENYLPQEMDKLNNPVIETRGDVVYFVVTDEPQQAKDAIDNLYK